MNARVRRLHRLLEVRRVAEDASRAQLQTAHAAVNRMESALARQQHAIRAASESSALALGSGDRTEWLFAEAHSEVAAGNCGRLLPLLDARREEIEPATANFLDRRRDRRQIQRLIGSIDERQRTFDDRKAQAAMDDWYLAQRLRKPR